VKDEKIQVHVDNDGMAGSIVAIRPLNKNWSIPKEKNQAIKSAVESVLNIPSIDVGRDGEGWQIECIQHGNKNYWRQKDGLYRSDLFVGGTDRDWLLKNGGIVFQVTRKSDMVTFSVGDEVRYCGINNTIKGFELYTGAMCAKVTPFGTEINAIAPINDISKLPPERSKLFTTTDGKDIFEGDDYWWFDEDFKLIDCKTHSGDKPSWYSNHPPTFSTREKAIEYVKQNRPMNLSMKELASCITNYIQKGGNPFGGLSTDKRTIVLDVEKLEKLIDEKTKVK
jgi:hypothetical protein